jgi:hypothetical protein
MRAEAFRKEKVREPARAPGDIGPRQPAIAPHDAFAVGDGGCDRLVDVRDVELHR